MSGENPVVVHPYVASGRVVLDARSLDFASSWTDTGVHESNVVQHCLSRLLQKNKPVLLDVGANSGGMSLLGVMHPSLLCHAFEPNPVLHELLECNIRLNSLEGRCKAHPIAISDRAGFAVLAVPRKNSKSGLSTLGGRLIRFQGGEKVLVEQVTLDQFVQMHSVPRIDMIKIDVEGAELRVLAGAKECIAACRPELVIECNAENLAQCRSTVLELLGDLRGLGYRWQLAGEEDLWCVHDPKRIAANALPQLRVLIRGNEHGFFSSFLTVLDNLVWCERNRAAASVVFDKRSLFHQSQGYRGSSNPWEYYFEPIHQAASSQAPCVESQGEWLAGIPYSFGHLQLEWLREPLPTLSASSRLDAHRVLKKSVILRAEIQDSVDQFASRNFMGFTIGVHVRGGLKYNEIGRPDNPPVSEYVDAVRKVAASLGRSEFGVFVATDSQEALDRLREEFPQAVFCSCQRMPLHRPVGSGRREELHTRKSPSISPAELGEQVLVDCLLLARCDVLVHHESNVAVAAAYFNPTLRLCHIEEVELSILSILESYSDASY